MSVLVVAPHADDEVLGCGGTIRKYADQGRTVDLCIVTEGYTPDWSREHLDQRADEIDAATLHLGISDIYELGLPAAKLDTIPQKELNDALAEIVRDRSPTEVFLPHPGDLHRDHEIVHEAGLVATRPHTGVEKIHSYETLSETEWGQTSGQFSPSVYVDVSETVESKVAAMKAYGSEVREFPHPRSIEAIEANLKKRGSEANVPAAEAFELVRERR